MKQPDIKNQKVLVKLSAVTELQAECARLQGIVKEGKKTGMNTPLALSTLAGVKKAIKILDLPIDIHS